MPPGTDTVVVPAACHHQHGGRGRWMRRSASAMAIGSGVAWH